MIEILILKKTGTLLRLQAQEDIKDIWSAINGRQDINHDGDMIFNHDYFYLTDKKGKRLILNRRYVMSISETKNET